MSQNETYSIQWNNFSNNSISGLFQFLDEGDLVDVTLAAGGHLYKAHRLILSVSSPYFKRMFTQIPSNQHAFIFLKDIEPSTLKDLIHFIYCGEVKVKEDALNKFISAALALEIKGLRKLSENCGNLTKGFVSPKKIKRKMFVKSPACPATTKRLRTEDVLHQHSEASLMEIQEDTKEIEEIQGLSFENEKNRIECEVTEATNEHFLDGECEGEIENNDCTLTEEEIPDKKVHFNLDLECSSATLETKAIQNDESNLSRTVRKYSQRFRPDWLKHDEYRDWLVQTEDETKCYCKYCDRVMAAKIYDINRHLNTTKHQKLTSNYQQ